MLSESGTNEPIIEEENLDISARFDNYYYIEYDDEYGMVQDYYYDQLYDDVYEYYAEEIEKDLNTSFEINSNFVLYSYFSQIEQDNV